MKQKQINSILFLSFNEMDALYLLGQRLSNLGVIDEIATRNSFSTSNQAQYFNFNAANAENPALHKYDVANDNSTFKALSEKLLYSELRFSQNKPEIEEVWVLWNNFR